MSTEKQTNQSNLLAFNSPESSSETNKTIDLNHQLKSFEQQLKNLDLKLASSHNSFRQKVSELSTSNQTNGLNLSSAQEHLRKLDLSFKTINTQSEVLNKKTASIGDLLEKSHTKQSNSIEFIDSKLKQTHNQLSQDIKQVDEKIIQLNNNNNQLETQSNQLLNQLNNLTSQHQNDLLENKNSLQTMQKNNDLKNTELENKIKQIVSIQDKSLEQLQQKIIQSEALISKEAKKFHEEITNKISNTETKLEKNIYTNNDLLQQNIDSLEIQNTSLHQQKNQAIEGISLKLSEADTQLKQTLNEQKNNKLAVEKRFEQGEKDVENIFTKLKKNLFQHDIEINHLDKETTHLNYHNDTQDETLNHLSIQTNKLEKNHQKIERIVSINSKLEKDHFISLSSVAALLLIFMLAGFFYTWHNTNTDKQLISQQQLQQNITLNEHQLSQRELQQELVEQKHSIADETVRQDYLLVEVANLKNELKQQKQMNNVYLQQIKQQQLSLQQVDAQMQYLNHTVGPLQDFKFGTLEGKKWILSQNSKFHSVELKRFSSKAKLFEFIEDEAYFLRNNIAYYSIHNSDKKEYVLVYGSFESINNAQIAMDDLPLMLADETRKLVTIKDIQSALL